MNQEGIPYIIQFGLHIGLYLDVRWIMRDEIEFHPTRIRGIF